MENKNITILSQYAQSNLSKIVFSLLGIILLSVSSKISIPFYPVPMTLQTFVVYFIAASMGMVGFYATVSYVILGLIGLPIFAAGGGFGYVMSPTFGFLYGMILASFVISYFSKNLFNKNLIKIIENLAKAYTEGNFDMAKDYFAEDGVHYVNNDEYTNDEIIAGYNFHSLLYDEMEHLTPWVTTMYYNDGSIYTNQWAEWTGKSKITGEGQKNNFHFWW